MSAVKFLEQRIVELCGVAPRLSDGLAGYEVICGRADDDEKKDRLGRLAAQSWRLDECCVVVGKYVVGGLSGRVVRPPRHFSSTVHLYIVEDQDMNR